MQHKKWLFLLFFICSPVYAATHSTLILCWNRFSYNFLMKHNTSHISHNITTKNKVIATYFTYKNKFIVAHQTIDCPLYNAWRWPQQCINVFLSLINKFHPKKIIALQTAGIINANQSALLKLYQANSIRFRDKCYKTPNPLKSSLKPSTVIYTLAYTNIFGDKKYCGQSTVLLDANSAAIPLAYQQFINHHNPSLFPKILIVVAVTDIDRQNYVKAKKTYEKTKYIAAKKMVTYVLNHY